MLKQAVIDQQDEAKALQSDEGLVARSVGTPLQGMLESGLITVITGIRRSGKSTLALQALRQKNIYILILMMKSLDS